MKVIRSPAAIQRMSAGWVRSGKMVGLVPTMGALHAGHLELIRRARAECGTVAVTIYVNPTQFGPREDLARYPRPRRRDLEMCRRAGVDLVFAPKNLYAKDHSTFVEEDEISRGRDGAARPGHFRGVATVVLKLFQLAQPTRAYFGQKDAQQLEVIRRLVRDLDVPVKIVTVPTVRAPDGLALSSRNRYLSKKKRAVAVEFARLLRRSAKKRSVALFVREIRKLKGAKLDYAEVAGDRLCAAVWIGRTRLIDNVQMGG